MRANLTKKIIAGKYKNRILKIPSKETTRSTKAIVLESYFNTLQFDIIDSVFVELFSGSGSMGLEALSRGASRVIFFERDREAVAILKENIASLGDLSCEVIAGDTFVNFPLFLHRLKQKAYFYIDPPFSIRDGMDEIYTKSIKLIESISKDMAELIAVEHMSAIVLPQKIGAFLLFKVKKFGNTTLSYYRVE